MRKIRNPVQSSSTGDFAASIDSATVTPELLTIDEVAALLRSTVTTIRRRVKAGDIVAFRLVDSGPWLFRRDDILRRLSPVQVSSAPSSGSRARTPPTAVDWVAGLTGSPSPKVQHGS